MKQLLPPTQGSQDFVNKWMSDDGNGGCIALMGQDCSLWWDTPLRDMVALYAREYEDFISTWITERALSWYKKVIGHRFQKVSATVTPSPLTATAAVR